MRKLFFMLSMLSAAIGAGELNLDRMSVYPADYRTNYQNRILSRTADMKSICVYNWINTNAGGTITLRVKYRLSQGSSASAVLSFMKKNGRNGDAGKVQFKLPAGTGEMAETKHCFSLPQDAYQAQIVISLPTGVAELELEKIWFEIVPDKVKLPGKCRLFYHSSTGVPAKVQTSVDLKLENDGLLIRFDADEPNPDMVKANTVKRDGAVWNDDCCEVFIYNPEWKKLFQFAMNFKGVQFDAEHRQAVDGDPWKPETAWNGEWTGKAEKTADGYACTFRIPYKTLGEGERPAKLLVNFARERKADNENSMWNSAPGNFNEVGNFAELDLSAGVISRRRDMESGDYLPVRSRTAGLELLSKTEKGKYLTGAWSSGAFLSYYPADFRKKYDRKSFTPVLRRYLEDLARNGMFGPDLPGAESLGMDLLKELNRKYGFGFTYAIFNSRIHARALKVYHAPICDNRQTDPAHPAYIKATLDIIAELKRKCVNPEYRKLVVLGHGIDEPCNLILNLYSRKKHPEFREEHNRAEKEIREQTGFGKFGLYDNGAKANADTQFHRIAFWRWWNGRFSEYLRTTSGAFHKAVPGVPYLAVNRNNCGGIDPLDAALLSPYADIIGADPYPTSSKVFGGMGRAIYHTGFSVKLLHDLANRSRTCVMPQMFIYHGGAPTPAYAKEWASQALKNGAEVFFWYDEGPANLTLPAAYGEMLRINKLLSGMNKLPIPTDTHSAILYSDADRWGLADSQGHPYYCLYVLLGEKLGANFRFVSPTGLKNGIHTLNGIKVLYIPRMRYAQPEDVKTILNFVRNGGTLVVFDPNIWTYHYDGTTVAERRELMPELKVRTSGVSSLRYKGKKAPVGKSHAIAPDAARPWSYDFPEGITGKVLASYSDGKPAIMERNIGKGKIIVSACQPFGYSSVVLEPGAWPDFFRDICKSAGEKTDLPIWNFVLPVK